MAPVPIRDRATAGLDLWQQVLGCFFCPCQSAGAGKRPTCLLGRLPVGKMAVSPVVCLLATQRLPSFRLKQILNYSALSPYK